MSSFEEVFDQTEIFLNQKGISSNVERGLPATLEGIAHFEEKTKLILPESFSLFYTEFADGYSFSWEFGEGAWGELILPNLRQLAEAHSSWRHNVHDFADDPHSLDKCIEPEFRRDAFAIWQRMESWIPLCREANGDHFCLDAKTGQIVYDQHDWFDGFGSLAKTNGILAGKDLADFLKNWSRFCFCRNASSWWGEFAKYGAIKWSAEHFDPRFTREI